MLKNMNFDALNKLTIKDVSPMEVLKTLEKVEVNRENKTLVSFELLDKEHEYFNCGEIDLVCKSWYHELFIMIKEFTSMPFYTFCIKHAGKKHEVHKISFKNTNFDFNKILETEDTQQYEENAYQIRINKSNGRVHGLLIRNLFFIIWLDPHHNLWDVKGYPKAKKLNPDKLCIDRMIYTDKEYNEVYEKELEQLEELKNIMNELNVKNFEELKEIIEKSK